MIAAKKVPHENRGACGARGEPYKLPVSPETMAKFDLKQRYQLQDRRLSELTVRVLLIDLRRTRRTA
jgi:hypothetical protein